MNALPPPPTAPVGPDGRPLHGTYAGGFDRVDLSALSGPGMRGRLHRLAHLKRWHYAFAASPEATVAFAIVDLGWAANAWILAHGHGDRRVWFDRGFIGVPKASVHVGDAPGDGSAARFRLPGVKLSIAQDAGVVKASIVCNWAFTAEIELDATTTPLTLVAPVDGGGVVNVTQKRALLPTRGHLVHRGKRFSLDGGFGGLDYTHGLLARRTAWRWAFACGKAKDGTPVGFNLVEGFNAGAHGEDALWVGDRLETLPPCRFVFDRRRTTGPWAIRSDDGRVDLQFDAVGEHREDRELVVAKSMFVQVAGAFRGTIRTADGRELVLDGVPGVTEDQDVRW